MKFKFAAFLCLMLLSACMPIPAAPPTASAVPSFTPLPPVTSSPFPLITATQTFISTESPTPLPVGNTPISTSTLAPTNPRYCADPQVIEVIDSFKSSMLNEDGSLLSLLVNPVTGMDVRFFRTGNVLTYSQEQAKFLFISTYQADWGAHPASGENVIGAFHEVVVPELQKFLQRIYTLHCNELRYGGATYQPNWIYDGNFYALHFPGTEEFGFLDWHTWVIGIDYVNGKPYIYALTQFFWEP
ncbi:MAG TPA: hypothetical protein PKE62_18620 [Anaerolineales bacterium]|nr:hypothetical protein [Anaerolineales bacterium]